MATQRSRIVRHAQSRERIQNAIQIVGTALGVEPPAAVPGAVRDSEMRRVLEAEALADWLETLVGVFAGEDGMATTQLVQEIREQALARMTEAMQVIADTLGIAVPDMPDQGRDPRLLQARQLEAHANFYHAIAAKLRQPDDLSQRSVSELKARADERGLDYPANARKADLIDLLEGQDGGDPD
jgi:hypothetical protein